MPSLLSTLVAIGLCVSSASAGSKHDPIVHTDSGLVVGETYSIPDAPDSVNKFLGIPFAISPPERFASAERAKRSKKPIIAKEKKPSCMQQFNYPEATRNFTIHVFNNPPVPESEDCLYLNVYTPNKPAPRGGWPVMFWLFGGGLQFGSGSVGAYDGENMAGYNDVVVVGGNYRTNVFGFINSPELPIDQRNLGFLDQRLALDWVQRNIRAFGGNPDKVTIFGESAGATSADLHVIMTPKNPPFRAAILQSGSANLDRGENQGWEPLVEGMGCKNASSAIACVRKKKASEIKEFIECNMLAFPPIMDNVTVAEDVRERRASGNIAKVPVMIGTTAEEARVYKPKGTVDEFLEATFPNMPELQDALREKYPLGSPNLETDGDVTAAIATDIRFTCIAKSVAKDYSAHVNTWRYLFNASFPNRQPFPDAGAYHSSEIEIVFGTYPREGATAQQAALSKSMMNAWTDFAKNPEHGPGWNAVGSQFPYLPALLVLPRPSIPKSGSKSDRTSGQRAELRTRTLLKPPNLTSHTLGYPHGPVDVQFGRVTVHCTPYLLQLGLTKSRTSLVWLAGPLSGLIMQPLVGVITDRSTSKWGRRRPFMIGGSFIVGLCLLVLGWASEIVAFFVADEETKKSVTIAVAVLSIYAVDFAINVAWFSMGMCAVGHLIGYAIGSIDMLATFGTAMGDSQFKQMTIISAVSLIFSVSVTSYAVKERVLISLKDSDKKKGAGKILAQLFRTTVNLPPRIKAICWAQFWAWIGWFPFLFYSSTWVGETYFRYEAPKAVEQSSDTLGDVGRLGSMSLVIFSSITFISSVILPFGVLSPDNKKSSFARRPPLSIIRLFNKIPFPRPDLQTAWMIAHIMFAVTMVFAPFAHSLRFATFIVAISGIPWAVCSWAPFAFMGVEINRLAIPSFSRKSAVTMITSASVNRHNSDLSNYDLELEDRGPSVLRLNHNSHSPDLDSDSDSDDDEGSSTGELAGIYLGVLNVYTTLPQFVGTFISWIVFSIFEPGNSPITKEGGPETNPAGADIPTEHKDGGGEWIHANHDGPNAIAVCLFIGAISALVACEATRRLRYVR
ncbi:hypothetical protein FQN55_001042 [Onygenales sp. PD_40]|nr:hypothetical protein FQN55_001042 [Onygenales sp. PD_40]